MQVWNRPPLPKASPLPETVRLLLLCRSSRRVQSTRQRLPKLAAPYQNPARPGGSALLPAPRLAVSLLRLRDPEKLPHQLGRPGFRHRRTSSSPNLALFWLVRVVSEKKWRDMTEGTLLAPVRIRQRSVVILKKGSDK
jgi:hypothetical protein